MISSHTPGSKHLNSNLYYRNIINDIYYPDGPAGKESACNAGDRGDMGLIPGEGRSLEKENVNSLRYSYLKNPIDRGAWRATVQRVTKSRT